MSEEDKDNKTEEASERKLKKAREKGDVPSSKEPGNVMSIFSFFILVLFILPVAGPSLAEVLGALLAQAAHIEVSAGATGLRDLGGVVSELALPLAFLLAPALATMIAAALFGVLIQGEVVVSTERIQPKLSKISPLQGLKRIFSTDTAVEFVKNLAKVAVVAFIGAQVSVGAVTAVWQSGGLEPVSLLLYLREKIALVLILTCSFLIPLAIIDIVWKRFQWLKKQRMSIKELRDEHKDSEGDPMIRRKREELRRERARQRAATAVPKATVVLTNPTHYAVALRYEAGLDPAPVCVAKGADLMAHQIRKLAAEHDVPMIENRPLARALYDSVEIDQTIPDEHWKAVAEILRYLMDLRARIRRAPPEGSTRRYD
ncbi:EscU/YscU/HrcU family type III secretion system export apparatus switch protein [Litorisediminicola beolgyonensis]|uniref:Flagellar biosynthesis protein FlhB n=1 Tax=Litorisediminicola beolgyonensis TaxID=1173614 RepID=A0ABW3ZG52_9RHOB